MKKLRRLFTIKTKFEAFLAIYALALGATQRGLVYMPEYPGISGQILALACIIAGGLMIDAVTLKRLHDSNRADA